MLQTYEAVLEPDGNLHFLDERPLPVETPRRVLVTVTEAGEPRAHSSVDWRRFVGTMKDSPNLNGDPVKIQQGMRNEWD